MRAHRALVGAALADPLEIRISDADADYRLYFGSGPRADIMVVVVVDLPGGFVKMSHLVRSARGAIEWSRQTP